MRPTVPRPLVPMVIIAAISLAACGSPGLRSSTGSGHWSVTASNLGQPYAATCWTATACIVAGNQGFVQTSDGGRTWQSGSFAAPAGYSFSAVAFSCPAAARCVAVGFVSPLSGAGLSPAVSVTRDGGVTWHTQTLPGADHPITSVSCPTPELCFAAGFTDTKQRAVIFKTDDGGADWTTVLGSPLATQEISCTSTTTCLAVGTGFDPTRTGPAEAATTVDGGGHWVVHGLSQVSLPSQVLCLGSGRCLVVGFSVSPSDVIRHPHVLFTDNLGVGWSDTDLGSLDLYSLQALSCGSTMFCVAVGEGANSVGTAEVGHHSPALIETHDGGNSWVRDAFPDNVSGAVAVACSGASFCVAGASTFPTTGWALLGRSTTPQ